MLQRNLEERLKELANLLAQIPLVPVVNVGKPGMWDIRKKQRDWRMRMWDYKKFPLEIRYHNAIPNWAKLIGLKIRTVHECEGGGFMIDKDQAEGIMDALYPKNGNPYTGLPKPTHWQTHEDEKWYIWDNVPKHMYSLTAIRFEGGAIFDMVDGWRQSLWRNAVTWTCPYCDAIYRVYDGYKNHVLVCDKKAQSIELVPDNKLKLIEGAYYVNRLGIKVGPLVKQNYSIGWQWYIESEGSFDKNGNFNGKNPHGKDLVALAPQDDVNKYAPDVTTSRQDKPSIPDCAYWSNHMQDFYSHLTGCLMGSVFHDRWYDYRAAFPKERDILYGKTVHAISNDKRVVDRALLEQCREIIHTLLMHYPTNSPMDITVNDAFAKLVIALQIEKQELSAPVRGYEEKI